MVAVIKENLSTRTARAGITHLPEVVRRVLCAFVITDADNALSRNTDFIFPDVVRFIIRCINSNPQFLFRQVKPFFAGQQFPGEIDGIVLEVIAEAEVTQHFEESMVTCSVADVFQVVVLTAGTDTALCCGGTGVRTFIQTEENIFELVHPCVSKKQRWIVVRNQRTALDNLMSFCMEKVEKRLTDLSGAFAHIYPEIKLK